MMIKNMTTEKTREDASGNYEKIFAGISSGAIPEGSPEMLRFRVATILGYAVMELLVKEDIVSELTILKNIEEEIGFDANGRFHGSAYGIEHDLTMGLLNKDNASTYTMAARELAMKICSRVTTECISTTS